MPSRSGPVRSPRSDPAHDSSSLTLGIDLGATKVVSGLVDADGRVVHHSGRLLHSNDGPGGVIQTVLQSARACLDQVAEPPEGVGIAVAAQVDPSSGTVIHAPNLGWRDLPLGSRVASELGVAVSVVNDARAATLAEWRHGAGRGESDLFYLALGTGVGGSAVIGGRLLEGGSHAFGEVGHLTIVAAGRKCHCPNSGCLEAYVGGWAIAERGREAVRADPAGGPKLTRRAGDINAITAQTVFQAAAKGDALAARIVRETERYLADGAVSISNAFNPAMLVVGGGLLAGHPAFLSSIESAIRARCQPPAAGTRVVAARFVEDAAMVGAAELARTSRL